MGSPKAVHIVDSDAASRGALARRLFGVKFHAEIYQDLDEFFGHCPSSGVVLVRDDLACTVVPTLIAELTNLGLWLPIIALSEKPQRGAIVKAIKAGALDYLSIPFETTDIVAAIDGAMAEAQMQYRKRGRVVEAHAKIALLSSRERDVVEGLTKGLSNKEMARVFGISSRTVEIHRMKAMAKLGTKQAADAVRLLIYATDFDEAA